MERTVFWLLMPFLGIFADVAMNLVKTLSMTKIGIT